MSRTVSLLLTLGMLFSMVHLADAATVSLAWDANTETNLAGYKLYYGTSPRAQAMYSETVLISGKNTTTWEITLPTGVYYLALTAIDSSGNESDFSNEVKAEISDAAITLGKPGKPIVIP